MTASADPFELDFGDGVKVLRSSGGTIHLAVSTVPITINRFSLSLTDDGGRAVPNLTIAKTNLAQFTYVSIPRGVESVQATMSPPPLADFFDSETVESHLSPASGTQRLTAGLTLFGQDDNYSPVEAPVNMTIFLNGAKLSPPQSES